MRFQGKDVESLPWSDAKTLLKQVLLVRPVNDALVRVLKAAPRVEWIGRVPVARDEVHCRVRASGPDVTFVLTNPARCNIAKECFWGEGERLELKERFALELFVGLARDASVVLDVGANTGIYSLAAAKANPSARVHAFEIMPEAFATLFWNVVRNDVIASVTCHALGVGDDDAYVRMPTRPLSSSIATSLSTAYEFDDGVRVPVTSLDSLGPTLVRSKERALMKIDVEATERIVFERGRRFFLGTDVDVICEILPGTDSLEVVEDVLVAGGFRRFSIRDGVLVPFDRIEPSADYHDWLFSRRAEPLSLGR